MALTNIEPLVDRDDRRQRQRRKDNLKLSPSIVTTPATPIQPPYFFEDGLRKVRPYHFTYNTWCKERWRGRELLWIFSTEFRDRPQEYYVKRAQDF